jgi:hypothetical protein
MGRDQIGSVAQITVNENVEVGPGSDPTGIIVIVVRKEHHISASGCCSMVGALAKTKGKAIPVGVTDKTIHTCLVCYVDAIVVPIMIGGRVTTLADAAVGGIRKSKLGRLLVNNRILHSRYTTLCYGAANKTQIVSCYTGMGISALFRHVGVVTCCTVNYHVSAAHLVIAHTAHTCCLSIWIVAGFADCLLLFPPWNVNVEHATFIGEVVTVAAGYIITNIMGGHLSLDGKRW